MEKHKKIIWLCVDSNGDEKLSSNPEGWQRFSPSKYYESNNEENKKVLSYDDITIMNYDHWIEYHDPKTVNQNGEAPQWNYLPKGTIKKIIGKELTWNDEPIKIEE